MNVRFTFSALLAAGAVFSQADTLHVLGYNFGGVGSIGISSPIVGTGHDNSFNGVLNGTTNIPVMFCFDLFQDLSVPKTFTVTIEHHMTSEAWVIDNASSVLAGHTAVQIDEATQIAVWELEYPTFATSSASALELSLASDLVTADGSGTLKALDTEYIYNGGRPGSGGQSMITGFTVPGPAAMAPFAVGLIGLLRKRFRA